ncbi:MAG: helix-turn-helix transcriptional regulator [Clostridiales bacterium]|nr:helix-turn-helix transcriptional regulator [Clostridiales bacterium]
MKINIGEKIKILRKEHRVTQKTLASYLGVMPQAISSWELGINYPKLEYIPIIAQFFDTTTDNLLDCLLIEQEHEIQYILDELEALRSKEDDINKYTLLEKAYQKYPFDYRIAVAYAWSLWQKLSNQNARTSKTLYRKQLAKHYEIIEEICQRVIDYCSIPHLRDQAIHLWACAVKELRGPMQAKQILNKLPASYQDTLPEIRETFWSENEQQSITYVKENIVVLTNMLIQKMERVCRAHSFSISIDEKIDKLSNILKIYEIIYEKKDFGAANLHVSQLYQSLAELYLEKNESEKALNFIECACETAATYDLLSDETRHSSFYVQNLSFTWSDLDFIENRCNELHYDLTHKSCYEIFINEPRFLHCIDKLKKII